MKLAVPTGFGLSSRQPADPIGPVSEPLRRLRQLRPEARFTLWVDGLDEELGATASIGALLPLASERRQLGNVTLIVSSRPGPHLDRFVADGATRIDLGAARFTPDTNQVLAALIDRELSDPAAVAALTTLAWPAAEVRASLQQRSERNFLFVRQCFEALRAGHGGALRDGGLPQGLDDIYSRLLTAMLRQIPTERQSQVTSVLAVLAVAQSPFSLTQLARFSGVAEDGVRAALELLRPFLDATSGPDATEYVCYHKSLRDCLGSPRHAAARWHVDVATAHGRIASTYFQAGGTASRLDQYGVIHGATHLAHAGLEGPETLLELLHENWRRHCRATTGSNRVFHHGLELARQHAATLPPAEACVRLIRLALTDVYLRSAESQMPDDAFELLVRMGQTPRALDGVSEFLEPVAFARRHAAIIRGLLADPAGDVALALRLFSEALQRLQRRPEWIEPEVTSILDSWPRERIAARRDILPGIDATLRQTGSAGPASEACSTRRRQTPGLPPPTTPRLPRARTRRRSSETCCPHGQRSIPPPRARTLCNADASR